jgi:hypothetical protein
LEIQNAERKYKQGRKKDLIKNYWPVEAKGKLYAK